MPMLLKIMREKRGWSQSELARRSGLHATTISLIESGRLTAYDVQIDKIAEVFGISRRKAAKLVREQSDGE